MSTINPSERDCFIENESSGDNREMRQRLTTLYRQSAFEQTAHIPSQLGEGYWRRIRTGPAIDLIQCDVRFHEAVVMGSREAEEIVSLGCCLDEGIRWSVEGRADEIGLDRGEISAFGDLRTASVCRYEEGKRFRGVSVNIARPDSLERLDSLSLGRLTSALRDRNGHLDNIRMTPALERIVKDIVECPYEGDVKQLYLSGKTLELIAVYIGEAIQERAGPIVPGMSRTDLDGLHRAKEILDRSSAAPPTLAELARMVCLNEYKLKKGFKLLFGMPVHAYVIERRLEEACRLLEAGAATITEASYVAGFGKPGRFAEFFRRKYGTSPSDFYRGRAARGEQ
ncbi:helix-turn-helix domain-containing protein [Cohnella fermenti]|uniref:helix-turn-helix domain-containing protein n=1 Tax=Cohnella fermenti TaxID=2565925 RepID=UPI001454CDC8|nr:AraC family transcriptional regulator [Cohnella fermenti]